VSSMTKCRSGPTCHVGANATSRHMFATLARTRTSSTGYGGHLKVVWPSVANSVQAVDQSIPTVDTPTARTAENSLGWARVAEKYERPSPGLVYVAGSTKSSITTWRFAYVVYGLSETVPNGVAPNHETSTSVIRSCAN